MLAMVSWKVLSASFWAAIAAVAARLCLVLLFGHYLEQLCVPHPLIADYRPYFFKFLKLFRSFLDVGM